MIVLKNFLKFMGTWIVLVILLGATQGVLETIFSLPQNQLQGPAALLSVTVIPLLIYFLGFRKPKTTSSVVVDQPPLKYRCPKCKTPIEADTKQCPGCGGLFRSGLETGPTEGLGKETCPQCGKENLPESKFCCQCSASLAPLSAVSEKRSDPVAPPQSPPVEAGSGARGLIKIAFAIAALLAVMGIFKVMISQRLVSHDRASITMARAQIDTFMTALGRYKLDTETFPTTKQGLQALRVKPVNVK